MGSPELPGESGGEDFHKPNHIPNIPIPSDSDNEDSNSDYEGYQPLPISDLGDDEEGFNNLIDDNQQTENSNLPPIESVDTEVTRQIWNEPRPRELQIELDSSRTQQIMSAMANITLPNASIPEWAMGVSEERWKEELLERIRQRNGNNS